MRVFGFRVWVRQLPEPEAPNRTAYLNLIRFDVGPHVLFASLAVHKLSSSRLL